MVHVVFQNFGLVPSFPKVQGWSLWFALCNVFSPQPTNKSEQKVQSYGLNALQKANHRDHPCTFGKSWRLNVLQSANHTDHPRTFRKLGTKSKILVNHKDHSCTLLFFK
ncbi:hypothetical protein Hanom_Chr09g00785331 [Helianthus anomalus]